MQYTYRRATTMVLEELRVIYTTVQGIRIAGRHGVR